MADSKVNIVITSDPKQALDAFVALSRALRTTQQDFVAAQTKVKDLSSEIKNAENPSKALTKQYANAQKEVKSLAATIDRQREALHSSSNTLKTAAVDVGNLKDAYKKLSDAEAEAASEGKDSGAAKSLSELANAGNEAASSLGSTSSAATHTGISLGGLKDVIAGLLGLGAIKAYAESVVGLSDKWLGLSGRLKQTTTDSSSLKETQNALFNVAQKTNTAYEGTVKLYTRSAAALKNFSDGQALSVKLTEAVNNSFKAQASSAEEIDSTITQLTQSIATDVVQWEDFGQLADTNLLLVNTAAKNLGYDGIGALKKAMSDGKVSNIDLVNSIVGGFDEIKAAAEQMPVTVAGAWTKLQNEFLKYIGNSKDAVEANRNIASTIDSVTQNLDGMIALATTAGGVLLTLFGASKIRAVILYAEALNTARIAAASFVGPLPAATTALGNFGRAMNAVSLAASALVGWEIGKWLNQFKPVQVLGAALAAPVLQLSALLKLLEHPLTLSSYKEFSAELGKISRNAKDVSDELYKVKPESVVSAFDRMTQSASNLAPTIKTELEKLQVAAKTTAESMAKRFDESAKGIGATLTAELATITSNYQQKQQAIDSGKQQEKTAIDEIATATVAAETTKKAAVGETQNYIKSFNEDGSIKKIWELAGHVKSAESQKVEAIQATHAAQNTDNSSELQRLQASTTAFTDAEATKIAAVLATKTQLETLWQSTYGQAIALAKAAGQDVTQLEQQGAQARIDALQPVVTAYKQSVDAMIGEENRLVKAIQQTQQEKLNFTRSTEDTVRSLQQQGLTAYAAYADKQKEIDEKQELAKKALLAGNFSEAKKYADEAIALAKGTAQAVTETVKDLSGKTHSKELVDKNAAISKSIEQITESANISKQAFDGLSTAQTSQLSKVEEPLAKAKTELADFSSQLQATVSDLNSKSAIKISVDSKAAQDEIDKLKALIAAQDLAVKIAVNPLSAEPEIAKLKEELKAANITFPIVAKFENDRAAFLDDIAAVMKTIDATLPVRGDFTIDKKQVSVAKDSIDKALSAPTKHTHTAIPDLLNAQMAINSLKQNTSSTHTVYVKQVSSGSTSAASSSPLDSIISDVPVYATGGMVYGAGNGTDDKILARLSNEEYVMTADAVKRHGTAGLDALNYGNADIATVKKFATGGAVDDRVTTKKAELLEQKYQETGALFKAREQLWAFFFAGNFVTVPSKSNFYNTASNYLRSNHLPESFLSRYIRENELAAITRDTSNRYSFDEKAKAAIDLEDLAKPPESTPTAQTIAPVIDAIQPVKQETPPTAAVQAEIQPAQPAPEPAPVAVEAPQIIDYATLKQDPVSPAGNTPLTDNRAPALSALTSLSVTDLTAANLKVGNTPNLSTITPKGFVPQLSPVNTHPVPNAPGKTLTVKLVGANDKAITGTYPENQNVTDFFKAINEQGGVTRL
ncbi:Caudovirus, tape measure, N-terminal [uncultured Caudovirales phage]|uniref:Caudovirus, tape measure, N-terminal n=1 Tax=uncultured Caudovirales phage TaxID=2100421 RepID=A0A6J5RVR6_9CAUD|nr:tail length tape measure protein [uncultured Caudovirales phage]CAB4202480.1 Caudovirus, tape measure, N-terminal [uncultured Caudovirales phage]